MTPSQTIDPALPVRDILARSPHLASALAAHGLDSCCGGVHPLIDACRAKGVRLDEVLADLESAHRAAEAYSIVPPTMSIREMTPALSGHAPGARALRPRRLRRRGWPRRAARLVRDGPPAPPRRLPAGRESGCCERRRGEPSPDAAARRAAASPFSPHFIIGSLFLTLTLGATTGMINLLRIAAGGEVPIDHRQIHGHTQVLGFAALFLMGIAYHALPRILGVGARGMADKRAVRAGFWLMFGGRPPPQCRPAHGAGTVGPAALARVGGDGARSRPSFFVRFVFRLIRCVREGKYDARDPLIRFVRFGTLYFAVAMVFVGAQGLWLAGNADSVLPASLNEPFYFAALYGFLLAWIYGFGDRIVSLFLGVGPAVRGTAAAALAAQAAGVVLAVLSWLPALPNAAALALRDAGLSLAALSALVYLAGNGFLWRRSSLPMLRTPGNPGFAIRAAFGMPRPLGGPAARRRGPESADPHARAEPLVGRRGAARVHDRIPHPSDRRDELPDPSGVLRKDALVPAAGPRHVRAASAGSGDAASAVSGGLPAALLRARLLHGDSRRARAGAVRLQPRPHDARTARPRDTDGAGRSSVALRVHAAGAIIRGCRRGRPFPFPPFRSWLR